MFNLIVALCAMPGLMTRSMSVSLPIATARSISAAEIPLKVPTGWKSTLNQGATVMTPDDVPEGKVYTVVITPLQVKAGKLDDVYDVGVKMIAEVGTYKALTQLQTAKSEGEWDYKFSIGTVEKDKSGFLAQVMGVKKGDVGGIVIVLTDSIETMQKYSDPFSNMIRTLGGSAKPPQAPEIAKSDGKVDLQYTVPAGWVESKREGATVIEASKDEFYTKYRWTMVVMPSQPLTGSLRENFQEYWKALISDNYESGVAPLPLVAEMSNGYVCAYDADGSAKHKVSGAKPTIVSVYVVAHGDRFVPILGILYGYEKQLENDMKRFIETARIPGSSNAKISLFSSKELVGDWTEGGTSIASYVTASGGYAGDASIMTRSDFHLRANNTFTRNFMGISSTTRLKESQTGKWSIQENDLVLKDEKGTWRYSLMGYGSDPKAGRFLVMGTNPNTAAKVSFSNPRGPFQASWFKEKS